MLTEAKSLLLYQFVLVVLEALKVLNLPQGLEDEYTMACLQVLEPTTRHVFDAMVNGVVLHHHRLSSIYCLLGSGDMGDWVKARSIAWYSCFLMTQYDSKRWIENFRVRRDVLQELTKSLRPLIGKKDAKYRYVIPVGIRVACSLYKLARGADYLQCSELFAIGKSTVHLVLHEFVAGINEVFKHHIKWPEGDDLLRVMFGFREFCGLPSIHGEIDVAQIHIVRPKGLGQSATDCYSFKSKGHSMQLQAIVDHDKRFREIFVGMPGFVNDSRVLRVSTLYRKALFDGLFELERGAQDGVRPYLLADKGYPLLPWLMIPHKHFSGVQYTYLHALYNKHHCRGRSVVENAFGILKKTFRELLLKTDLDIAFLPKVVHCCCLLHNIILDGRDVDVEELLNQLQWEESKRVSETLAGGPSARSMSNTFEGMKTDVDPTLEGDELLGVEQRSILESYLGNMRSHAF